MCHFFSLTAWRRAGVFWTNQEHDSFDWKVPIGVATSVEGELHGGYKADDDFLV